MKDHHVIDPHSREPFYLLNLTEFFATHRMIKYSRFLPYSYEFLVNYGDGNVTKAKISGDVKKMMSVIRKSSNKEEFFEKLQKLY